MFRKFPFYIAILSLKNIHFRDGPTVNVLPNLFHDQIKKEFM